jgi:hypothetical protein
MFAHQVIEDLKRDHHYIEDKNVSVLYELIRHSQKFHFGIVQDILSFCLKHQGVPMFTGPLGGVNIPYKVSWFDYVISPDENRVARPWSIDGDLLGMHLDVGETSKFAILTNELEPLVWDVVTFSYFDKAKKWAIDALGYKVDVGKERIGVFGAWKESMYGGKLNKVIELSSAVNSQNLGALNSSLMLLDCKNIGTEKVIPPPKLNTKRAKGDKGPLFTYHILYLKPTTQREKSIPKHLWTNRIHLCRGHFKTYTEENPLFGHIVGRFWWQAHVAGRNKKGVVLKDYEIKMDVASSVTQMRSP